MIKQYVSVQEMLAKYKHTDDYDDRYSPFTVYEADDDLSEEEELDFN